MSKPQKESKDPAEAKRDILSYMETQNRPYSITDVLNNLHKKFGKTLVTKTLESLTTDGSIKEKTYGKQKVYVFSQDGVQVAEAGELKSMDESIDKLTQELKNLHKEIQDLSNQHKKISSSMSLDELKSSTSTLTTECRKYKEKLQKLQEGQVLVTKEEKDTVYKSRNINVKEWKKRKRMANDILEAILEGYPKPKKTLYEEIGIETDEDYKVNIPEK